MIALQMRNKIPIPKGSVETFFGHFVLSCFVQAAAVCCCAAYFNMYATLYGSITHCARTQKQKQIQMQIQTKQHKQKDNGILLLSIHNLSLEHCKSIDAHRANQFI